MRPLIIAIHGAVANAATWNPVHRLLDDTCDFVATDLPGHGTRRAHPFSLDVAIDELVRDVREAALQRRVFVAGDSLGGYVALAVAAKAGDRVAGVIAGSCTYPMHGLLAALARFSLAAGFIRTEAPFRMLTRMVTDRETSAAIVGRGFAPRMRGVTLRALLGRDIRAEIAAIDAPVVFVDGALDIPIVFFAHAWAHAAKRGGYRIVPHAGHGVGLTHPAAFVEAIRSCIAAAASA